MWAEAEGSVRGAGRARACPVICVVERGGSMDTGRVLLAGKASPEACCRGGREVWSPLGGRSLLLIHTHVEAAQQAFRKAFVGTRVWSLDREKL